jgi:hypothetical protein
MNTDNFYLEQEVLSEFTAEIIADFTRYFIKNKLDINDMTNPLVVLNKKLCELKSTIFSDKVKSIEDLKILEEKFLFAESILKELQLKVA